MTTYPEWIPFALAAIGLITAVINGMIAFIFKGVMDRLSRLEGDNANIWHQISNMRVDSARDGATRADVEKIQVHLQNQDKQLAALGTLLARLVPQAQSSFGAGA